MADRKCRKLFIGNIDYGCTDDEFRQYFEGYGELEESIVMKTRGKPRGFGFVIFKSREDAERVMTEDLNLGGRQLKPEWAEAKNKALSNPTKKLYLRGIPDMSDTELADYFKKY